MHLPAGARGKVKDFSAGDEHCALLTVEGQVFVWGYGNDGQLGNKDRGNLNQPKKITFDKKIIKVACGGGHTGLITEDGELYLFGRGRDGQLGRGDEVESIAAYRTDPKRVGAIQKKENAKAVEIALGNNHSVALCEREITK